MPDGVYSVTGFVFTMAPDQPSTTLTRTVLNTSLVGDPQLPIDGDRAVVLDARRAVEVRVRTPDHVTWADDGGALQLDLHRVAANGVELTRPAARVPRQPARAALLPATDRAGDPRTAQRHDPLAPGRAVDPDVRGRDLASVVRQVDGAPTGASMFSEASYEYQPYDTFSITTTFPLPGGPRTRVDYHNADPDTRWAYSTPELLYNHQFPAPPVDEMSLSLAGKVSYRPGEREREEWGGAPVTAGLNPRISLRRSGNLMRLSLSGFVDRAGHAGDAYTSTFPGGHPSAERDAHCPGRSRRLPDDLRRDEPAVVGRAVRPHAYRVDLPVRAGAGRDGDHAAPADR